MVRDEIIAAVVRNPFRPFTICLTDGQQYQISRPEQVLVTMQSVVIGIPIDPQVAGTGRYPEYDFHVTVDSFHITRLEESLPGN